MLKELREEVEKVRMMYEQNGNINEAVAKSRKKSKRHSAAK
jgi:hypothetical protein